MRFTIKLKLALAFGVIILLSLGAGLLAINDLGTLNTGLNQLLIGPVERVRLSLEIENTFNNIALSEKNMMLADNDQVMGNYDSAILKGREDLKSLVERLRSIAIEAGKQDIDKFSAAVGQYVAVQDKVRELRRQNSQAKATALSEKDAQQQLDQILNSLGTCGTASPRPLARLIKSKPCLPSLVYPTRCAPSSGSRKIWS